MEKIRKILIILALIIYCFAFQGLRGLYENDEGRYTAIANEMLRRGDWVHPYLNHKKPHYTKPPLTYWAIAASIKAFGRNEFAARLPGALAFFFTILLVYLIGRVFLTRRPWIAPLIYGTSLFPFIASNVITTDNLLTLWETAAVFAFIKAMWGRNLQMRTVWVLAMGGFFGLAFMTKGPPGLFPLIAIIVYLKFTPVSERSSKISWFPGLIIFLAVALPWFVLVIKDSSGLGSYFILDEIIGRVTGKHGHNRAWYGAVTTYAPVLILGTLPWTYWLVRDGYRGLKRVMRERAGFFKGLDEYTRFVLLWFLCPMIVFMLVSSRLTLYILPLFIPLSLLLALRLSSCASLWTAPKLRRIGYWVVVLLLLRVVSAKVPSSKDARLGAQEFDTICADTYDEITFYEVNSVNGLNFYLHKQMERVDIETLANELREDERRIWIVKPSDRVELENGIRQHSGRRLKPVSRLRSGYLIFREEQADRDIKDNISGADR